VFEVDFSTLQEPSMTSEATNTPTLTFNADEALAFAQARKLRGFYLHLTQYVVTLCILLTINLWTSPHYLWVGWVAMGWGIGIFFHGLRAFDRFNPFGAEWEKKQVEKRLGRKI
jgi:hypothetical protein